MEEQILSDHEKQKAIFDEYIAIHDRVHDPIFKSIDALLISHGAAIYASFSFFKDLKDKLPAHSNYIIRFFIYGFLCAILSKMFMAIYNMDMVIHFKFHPTIGRRGKQNWHLNFMYLSGGISVLLLVFALILIAGQIDLL